MIVSQNTVMGDTNAAMGERQYNLIVLLGPNASGKTKLAVRLAGEIGAEVISADSRQVYRGMDLGTGKDLEEFTVDGTRIPYHLIDIVDPDYEFNVFEYQRRFYECFSEVLQRGAIPIMVGGTGLYIEAVIRGYRMMEVPGNPVLRNDLKKHDMETLKRRLLRLKPSVHNTTDFIDRDRLIRAIEIADYTRTHESSHEDAVPPISPLTVGIRWQRDLLRRRITERLERRFEKGMVDEVRKLHQSGTSWEKLSFFGLEYRYISLYLKGEMSYEEMFQTLNKRIHQFSKRQETWFRRMEKKGVPIHWIDEDDYDALKTLIDKV